MKLYTIPGDPTALARPRVGKRCVFDGQRQLKVNAKIYIESQYDDKPLINNKPLHLDVIFFLRTPKSKKLATQYLKKSYHIFKPDLSNLIKFVEDCITGTIYYDDCLISSITAKKIYDENPRTEFTIEELKI